MVDVGDTVTVGRGTKAAIVISVNKSRNTYEVQFLNGFTAEYEFNVSPPKILSKVKKQMFYEGRKVKVLTSPDQIGQVCIEDDGVFLLVFKGSLSELPPLIRIREFICVDGVSKPLFIEHSEKELKFDKTYFIDGKLYKFGGTFVMNYRETYKPKVFQTVEFKDASYK